MRLARFVYVNVLYTMILMISRAEARARWRSTGAFISGVRWVGHKMNVADPIKC
jgi:hypothetical protein